MVANTRSFDYWLKSIKESPFVIAIDTFRKRLINWTLEWFEWLSERLRWIIEPAVIRNVWMTSIKVLAIVWLLSWCKTTQDLWWWLTVTWNPFEIWFTCNNSVDSWNVFEESIKVQLTRSINESWFDKNRKKMLLSAVKDWWIPSDIKEDFCLDNIKDLEVVYRTPYGILWKIFIYLKVNEGQENVQYVTAKLVRWWKYLLTYDLKPRIIWSKETKTASNI